MEQEKNEIFLNEIENAKNYIIHSLRGEELKPFAINFLSDFTKAKISQLIGDDIDKIFLLTADDLRHIFNRHGELGKKVKRRKKEFLMKPTDILRIPDILAQPDSIELTPFDIKNGQGIRFSKKFDDGRIFCVFVEMWLDGLNYHIKTGYKNALQGLIDLFVISDLLIIDNENLSGTNSTQKVPDWSNDTPEAARDRGFRLVNGCPYFRNILNDYYLLNETNISFGDKIVKGRYAVVDLYHIQPSHINGQRNPRYFLDEAQPKNRIDQASVLAYKNIAKNLRPEEIIDGNTAFIGAPIVNYKGEVIQGNNRIMALRELFDNNAEYHNQLADYSDAVYLKIMKTIDLDDPKNYSFEIDSDWGWHEWEININGQITISHPIIVRLVDVIDFTAIMLGQKTAQDTESGGEQALDTNRIRTQLSDEQFTSFANILLNSYDDDESLKETITCNASEALKFLYKLKTINDTQFQTALKENGLPTDKTIDSLMELLNENIFNNADTDLRQRFNALPNLAKRGLLKVMHRDVQSPKDSRIKNIVQEAINAFDKIKKAEDAFAKAKTEQEADSAVKFWSTQTHIDFAGVNSELFSQEALKLASVFRSNTQKQITQKFNKFFDYVQGKGGDIFNKVKQLPFAEAFDVVFDLSTIKVIPRAKDEAQVQSFRELTDEEIILKIKLMNTIY